MRSKNPETMLAIKKFAEQYYFNHYHSLSKAQIAEAVDITKGTACKYLMAMRENGMIDYDGRNIRTGITEKIALKTNRAAILGSIACGPPQFAEENIEEYVSLPEALFGKVFFYLLRARGESMIEAGIDDGDLIVVRKQCTAENGDIVVALMEEEATLKHFYQEKGKIRLHPENKEMEDIIVSDCIIQGVAVSAIKAL